MAQTHSEVPVDKFNFRENNFDLIRLLAAFQVVFIHGCEHLKVETLDPLAKILGVFPGVPIFFVVSGFLISASLERSTSLRSYAFNRFLRIYPALWACFLFSLGTVMIFFQPHIELHSFLAWTAAQLSIGQFYNPTFLRDYGVGSLNGSLWTIPVELQFYLILPFLYHFFNRLRWNRLAVGITLVLFIFLNQANGIWQATSEHLAVKLFGVSVIPYLYLFFLGVILQRHQEFVANLLANRLWAIFAIYLLSIPIANAVGLVTEGNYMNPFSSLLLALLTISAAYSHTNRFSRILRGNDISYGVYIYHMVVVNALLHTARLTPFAAFSVMITLTTTCAFLSWRFIETPALRLKKYSVKTAKPSPQ